MATTTQPIRTLGVGVIGARARATHAYVKYLKEWLAPVEPAAIADVNADYAATWGRRRMSISEPGFYPHASAADGYLNAMMSLTADTSMVEKRQVGLKVMARDHIEIE